MNNNVHNITVQNGDIWVTKKIISEGSMNRGGIVLVVQCKQACDRSPNVTIIPVASKPKTQPTHVIIPANKETNLIHDSISQAENINTISKSLLNHRLGFVNDKLMKIIHTSILIHLGMIKFL